jgi:hypothetical protein
MASLPSQQQGGQQQRGGAQPGMAGGIARSEASHQADMMRQQKMRGPEKDDRMTAPQHSMQTQPDCGEESYKGAGKLRGKRAMITGGDSGIGRAAVIAYAREGADIALVYKSNDKDAEVSDKGGEGMRVGGWEGCGAIDGVVTL